MPFWWPKSVPFVPPRATSTGANGKKAAIHNHKTLGIILFSYAKSRVIIMKFKVTDKLPFINLNLSIFVMYIGCMNGLRYLLQVFMYIANFIAS